MKKKVLSVLLVSAMAVSMFAGCGSSGSDGGTQGGSDGGNAGAAAEGENKLVVWAWDANFNIPALQAAADDYKENVDPDFELVIEEQSQSSDVENAVTLG